MILKATTELYKDNKLAWPRSRFLAKFTVLLPNSGKVLLKAKYAGRLWDTVFMENMTWKSQQDLYKVIPFNEKDHKKFFSPTLSVVSLVKRSSLGIEIPRSDFLNSPL